MSDLNNNPDLNNEQVGSDASETAKKKKKKRKLYTAIGVIIIVVGICIMAYPFVSIWYHDRESKKILAEAYRQIDSNSNKVSGSEENPVEGGSKEVGEDTQQATTAAGEDVENPDSTEQGRTNKNTNDRLVNQELYGVIEIPAIDLVYPVVVGAEAAEIDYAIGHLTETENFGEDGNCCIAGHRGGTSGPYFKDLDKLKADDEVVVTDMDGVKYTYLVVSSFDVNPKDVWVTTNDIDQDGKDDSGKWMTLITCDKNSTKRLIVRCKMQEEES